MPRVAPPPDFHYVGLEPGPSRGATATAATLVGATTFSAGIVVSGGLADFAVLAASAAAGTVAAWITARRVGFGAPTVAATRAAMGISPWGITVSLAPSLRVLRWSAVRDVTVERVQEMDNATPAIRWSIVTVRTEHEAFCGRTAGAVCLERLEANLGAWASESSRPPSLDLDGRQPLLHLAEPAFEQLLAAARCRLRSGRLGGPSGYRGHDGGEALRTAVLEILETREDTPGDPRALAAVLAAETDNRDAASRLVRLASAPHPLLACIARAAAVRLGVPCAAVGAPEEVGDFVPLEDLEQISAWAADYADHEAPAEGAA